MADQQEKERLILGARDKFFSSGFSKTTVDEIATELGMSKKTVYKFFPSKEELLIGVVRFMTGRVERQLDQIIASDRPFEQKLAGVLATAGQVTKRVSPAFMDDVRRNMPELWHEVEEFRREKIFSKVKNLIQQAKNDGVLRPDLNVDLFYLTFLHAAQGILNPATLMEHSFSADEAFRGVFRILFLGAMSSHAEERYRAVEDILALHSHVRLL